MTITWTVQSNYTYTVQNCDTLAGPWQMIGSQTNATSTNTTLSYTDTSVTSVTQRYYRIGLVTP